MPPKKADSTKADTATDTATITPAPAPEEEPKLATGKDDAPPYGEQANEIAGDARALAERHVAELGDLRDRIDTLQRESVPDAADTAAADGIRRIPMAVDDVTRALQGLMVAAADLQRAAG